MKALIIDDEPGIRFSLGYFLSQRGYELLEAPTSSEGLSLAREFLPDIVFLDMHLPDSDGELLLPHLVVPEIGARVIMMTAYAEIEKAVRSMKCGAENFLAKPFDLEQVALILERIENQLRREKESEQYRQLYSTSVQHAELIGYSPLMLRIQRLIALMAENLSTPVLILGESGSGKELIARAIHRRSKLKGPLVEINSACLSDALLESELFGHEKGAFTDASSTKVGLFELAHNGTIFFDEIGEMPLSIQAKLLKVLDTRKFRRVGGVADITTNARFIGATNRDLPNLVHKGAFREDLYYRIHVMPIFVPPLRERDNDILLLAEHFVQTLGEDMGKGGMCISPSAMDFLVRYKWPGNVRELKNVIERAIILAEGHEILPEHIPSELRLAPLPHQVSSAGAQIKPLHKIEEEYIEHVLRATGNHYSNTASLLGISRSTLHLKLAKMKKAVL
ncbi:MAG: sigma-54-dependent Fis family transcriptional regulator [Geobacter sp.]|nr:MAG: sigma-54-dependent Fis family transcriptional regulator [Geobacter sp.]